MVEPTEPTCLFQAAEFLPVPLRRSLDSLLFEHNSLPIYRHIEGTRDADARAQTLLVILALCLPSMSGQSFLSRTTKSSVQQAAFPNFLE